MWHASKVGLSFGAVKLNHLVFFFSDMCLGIQEEQSFFKQSYSGVSKDYNRSDIKRRHFLKKVLIIVLNAEKSF